MERCVGWLKENRRVRTRFDKPEGSFLAVFAGLSMEQSGRAFSPLGVSTKSRPAQTPGGLCREVSGAASLRLALLVCVAIPPCTQETLTMHRLS